MTGAEVLEVIQQFWLQFALTAISGFLAWRCKKWYNAEKSHKEELQSEELQRQERAKIMETAVLAMLHDRLIQSLVYFLKVKEITSDEMDNIKLLYESYKSLGGNGTIKILYERFERYVRIIPPEYLSD